MNVMDRKQASSYNENSNQNFIGYGCLAATLIIKMIIIIWLFIGKSSVVHAMIIVLILIGIVALQVAFLFILKKFAFIIHPILLIAYLIVSFIMWYFLIVHQHVIIKKFTAVETIENVTSKFQDLTKKNRDIYVLIRVDEQLEKNNNEYETAETFLKTLDEGKDGEVKVIEFYIDYNKLTTENSTDKKDDLDKKRKELTQSKYKLLRNINYIRFIKKFKGLIHIKTNIISEDCKDEISEGDKAYLKFFTDKDKSTKEKETDKKPGTETATTTGTETDKKPVTETDKKLGTETATTTGTGTGTGTAETGKIPK